MLEFDLDILVLTESNLTSQQARFNLNKWLLYYKDFFTIFEFSSDKDSDKYKGSSIIILANNKWKIHKCQVEWISLYLINIDFLFQ